MEKQESVQEPVQEQGDDLPQLISDSSEEDNAGRTTRAQPATPFWSWSVPFYLADSSAH